MDSTNEKEKEKQENSSRFILISIILVTILVIIVLCLSFSVFKSAESNGDYSDSPSGYGYGDGKGNNGNGNGDGTGNGSGNNGKTHISMTYTEKTNGISIEDALPMSDAVGKTLSGEGQYFNFTIHSEFSKGVKIVYEIAAIKDKANSTISDDNVKLYLEKQVSGSYESVMEPSTFTPISQESKNGSPAGSMILYQATKKESDTDNFRLRMWLKEDANVKENQSYTVKVNVYGKAS